LSWIQLFPVRLVAGATSWLAKTRPNVAVLPKVDGVVTALTVEGLGVSDVPIVALVREVVSTTVTTRAEGSTLPVTGEAMVLESTLAGILSTPTKAMKVASTTVDLTQTTYVLTASSTGTWAGTANAQGANNGTNATNTNTLVASGSGALTLAYASQFNKTKLTISGATLSLFWSSTAALAGPATNLVQYSLDAGASWSTIISTTAAQSFGTTPQSYSLTSAVGQSWQALTDLRIRYTFTAASGLPSTVSVDAVRLTVQATQTVLS
jgi:hypothetical protein